MQDTGKFRENTNDQYYTKRTIAENLVNILVQHVSVTEDTLWIEPSAGSGAFLGHAIQGKVIAIDCDPKAEGPKTESIIKGDFLKWTAPAAPMKIFFGNPPFGKQGSTAKKFIQHSAAQGADIIAFILPRSFLKPSMNRTFPPKYHLTHSAELPKNSFEVNKKDYDVPCVFQIWEKRSTNRPALLAEREQGFEYVKEGFHIAFRRVGGLAGTCYLASASATFSPQSHHFLKFRDDLLDRLPDIQKKINSHIFPSNTTGPRSLSKGEINEVINRIISELV